VKRLLGWIVLIGMIVFGLSYVAGHWPSGNRFGCGNTGAAVAHADTTACPPNIMAAADDAQWAAQRYDAIKGSDITTSEFYDQDGVEHRFTSGEDGDADRVNQILRAAGVPFPRRATVHPAAAHVETKAAARMRDNGVTEGVMVINNPRGVCGADNVISAYGCAQVLSVVLPAKATLVVWWPAPQGMASATFIGGDQG
jgi:hypothetical protein